MISALSQYIRPNFLLYIPGGVRYTTAKYDGNFSIFTFCIQLHTRQCGERSGALFDVFAYLIFSNLHIFNGDHLFITVFESVFRGGQHFKICGESSSC